MAAQSWPPWFLLKCFSLSVNLPFHHSVAFVCRKSVCVCKQWFCNMQDGLLREKLQYHGKKKLSQAHAMLDTKESKFDKSSSSVVLRVTIAFFLW